MSFPDPDPVSCVISENAEIIDSITRGIEKCNLL